MTCCCTSAIDRGAEYPAVRPGGPQHEHPDRENPPPSSVGRKIGETSVKSHFLSIDCSTGSLTTVECVFGGF